MTTTEDLGRAVENLLGSGRQIAERKSAAEEELRRSQLYLSEAQRLSHTGSFGWKPATGQIIWSDETFRIFEFDPTSKVTVERIVQRTHPDDRLAAQEVIGRATRERTEFDLEHRLLMPNGCVKYVHVAGRPSMDREDRFEFVGAVTDITERKRAEQRLIAQYTVSQALAESGTLEEVTPRILRAVCEYLTWDLGQLWRTDREMGVIRCVEAWHKESLEPAQFLASSRDSMFLPGIGLPGRVWSCREPAYIPDVVEDSNFPRSSIAILAGLHAAFAFPIVLGGEVLGVMEFFSREIRQPDQDLLNMMATIGSQIGQFIEHKRAEEELRASERKYPGRYNSGVYSYLFA